MTFLIISITAWSKLGTEITWADLWDAAKPPFLSGLLAGAAGLLVKFALDGWLPLMPYVVIGVGLVLGLYAWVLLIVLRQKHVYMDLVFQLLPRLQRGQEAEMEPAVRLP